MIKPEDIPRELITATCMHLLHERQSSVAAILNAAIEAGVVSPPCYFIRHGGRTFKTHSNVRLWPGKPEYGNHVHWKGQTE